MRKPQCFCFPCAGGAATFFQGIEKDLPDAELVKMEYAGHGMRRKEPFYTQRFAFTPSMSRSTAAGSVLSPHIIRCLPSVQISPGCT